MSYLFANKLQTFFDANGNPLSGGKIYAYADGTSSLLNTYSNSALSSANTNPVVLNSAGKPPQNIYLSASAYRLELYTSADVLVAQCADVKGQLPVINPATDANKAVVVNSGATGYTTAAVALGSASYITVDAEASLHRDVVTVVALNISLVILLSEDFFEELDEDDGRVEVEEDGQRKGHAQDDDPRHEAVEVGFHQVCPDLRKKRSSSNNQQVI